MTAGTPSTADLLEVRGLRVEYRTADRRRVTAVDDLSFAVGAGRITGIVGESGCGKTSLARALIGLEPVPPGSLRLEGRDLAAYRGSKLRQLRRGIQHVFQDPAGSLSPRRTIRQALAEPLALYRIGNRGDREHRIGQALHTVGLESGLLDRYPHELSGGQRQRVALARALVSEPALIVADEPMSSLDVSAQARAVELIRRVREEKGVAFVLISHDLAVVRQLADEVGVMFRGRLVEFAATARLFRAPAHPYTRALLAAAAGAGEPAQNPAVTSGKASSPLTPSPGCVFHSRCPHAMERCARETPMTRPVADAAGESTAHTVRCHLWT